MCLRSGSARRLRVNAGKHASAIEQFVHGRDETERNGTAMRRTVDACCALFLRVGLRDGLAMASAITVTVRCFAAVRELTGCDRLQVELPTGATVVDLRAALHARHSGLQALRVAWAVNHAYVKDDRALQHGDEIALIPPISGGSPDDDVWRLDFCHGLIDAHELERQARTDRDGAVCSFTGTTRDHNEGAAVDQLAYEAYEPMAQSVVGKIVADVLATHAITRVRIAHRLGVVPLGEAAVVVVVSAPHRAPAFEACRAIMDRIKHEAPIWKRERLRDAASERWVGELPRVEPEG